MTKRSTIGPYGIYETMPADAVVICAFARDSCFADDVKAACSHCRAAIAHRPHVPATVTKLCPRCGTSHMRASPPQSIGITRTTADEVRLYFAARGKPKQ